MAKDPEEFNIIAKTIFSPIYPVLAAFMLKKAGRTEGICLDLGTGPGMLACSVARQSRMEVFAVDNDPRMVRIAARNSALEGLSERIVPIRADVHALPFCTASVNLIVSRGSLMFWENRPRVFREIERMLTTDGIAIIGGGFGNKLLKKEIFQKMRTINPDWDSDVKSRTGRISAEQLKKELRVGGISRHSIIDDETGIWIEIRKP
jgi:ubiquinone/menaquinone biosynthesis C-methylase UbiE